MESHGPQPASHENVLFVLLGLAPAVLTESVWALAHASPPVRLHRVIAFGTRPACFAASQALFGSPHAGWVQLSQHFAQRSLPVPIFGPESSHLRTLTDRSGRELEDVRTGEDLAAAADALLENLRAWTSRDDTTVFASLAGGRKSLGALMALALSLVGRPRDRLVHVLIDDPWASLPHFFFPSCLGRFEHPQTQLPISSSDAKLALADIPFVALGSLLSPTDRLSQTSFSGAVARARSILGADKLPPIDFNVAGGQISIGASTFQPAPKAFALLFAFALRAHFGQPSVPSLKAVSSDWLRVVSHWAAAPEAPRWALACRAAPEPDWSEDPRRWLNSAKRQALRAGARAQHIAGLWPNRRRLSFAVTSITLSVAAPLPS